MIVAWVLADEPSHERASVMSEDIAAGRIQAIIAPNTSFEIRSAFVRAARRKRIEWNAIPPRLAYIQAMSLVRARIDFPDRELLRLCRSYRLGWGDAHHVLVAERLRLPLVTADDRLVRALAGSTIWAESIASRPLPE